MVAEGGFVVVDGLVLDLVVLDEVLGGGFEDEAVLVGPVGAEALVDAGDDLGQVLFLGIAERSGAGVDGDDFAFVSGEGDGAFEDLLVAEVGEFDFGAQVDDPSGVLVPDEGGQGPAVDVVAFEVDVGELDDLGQEAVHPHEAGQRVPEHVLVLFVEVLEAFDAGLHGGVDLFVRTVAEHESGGLLHLARVQDVEVVQVVAGVEQQVGIGGRRHGLAVVDGEGVADVVAVVDEVEDERAVLVGMGPVEA